MQTENDGNLHPGGDGVALACRYETPLRDGFTRGVVEAGMAARRPEFNFAGAIRRYVT